MDGVAEAPGPGRATNAAIHSAENAAGAPLRGGARRPECACQQHRGVHRQSRRDKGHCYVPAAAGRSRDENEAAGQQGLEGWLMDFTFTRIDMNPGVHLHVILTHARSHTRMRKRACERARERERGVRAHVCTCGTQRACVYR